VSKADSTALRYARASLLRASGVEDHRTANSGQSGGSRRTPCTYCGLEFGGRGYSPDNSSRFCCYGCYLVSRITGATGEEGLAASIILRLGIGAFLSMNVMMISLVLYTISPGDLGPSVIHSLRWAMLILSTPAVAILGGPFFRCGLRDLAKLRIGTDALIATGAFAAYAVSAVHVISRRGEVYFDTGTMLLLIVTLGRLLEASAKSRTSRAIREMMSLTPDTARVIRDGLEVEMPSGELREGDIVLVKPGEKIPADGTIISGSCLVEEAAFTGEAAPRSCSPGDEVFGGSIDCDGVITVEARSVGSDTLAARIEEMVLQARRDRAPVERLATRVAAVFVPVVWLAAAGAAAYWGLVQHDPSRAWMSALAALVVACPCALGLATPMATCLAAGTAARRGILIRSGEVLERLPRIRRVFFDKTGTLTMGKLSVYRIHAAPGTTPEEALKWAAPLEAASGHVIGQAIAAKASGSATAPGAPFPSTGSGLRMLRVLGVSVSEFRTVPGFGVEGRVAVGDETRHVTVGSLSLLSRDHAMPPELALSEDEESMTAAYIGWEGAIRGVVLLSDEPRPEARDVVAELRRDGIRVAVLSGDRQGPTQRLAGELGIGEVYAECSPEDKAAIVAKAHGTGVAVVGDGINDAPALSGADVGIAIGSGTDLARESSDVTLLGDDLSRISEVIALSRVAYGIIRQNLAFSFGYNTVALGLACMGFVHPLIAALAMFVSSLCVISNSLRIKRIRG